MCTMKEEFCIAGGNMQTSKWKMFGGSCAQKEQYSECNCCWGSPMCWQFQLPCKWSGTAWSHCWFPWITREMQNYLFISGKVGAPAFQSQLLFCTGAGDKAFLPVPWCAKGPTLQPWQLCVSAGKGLSPPSCAAAPGRGWSQIPVEIPSYPSHSVL